jgi:hypothetical protein
LIEGADAWPATLQSTGVEGDVHYLVFPQGNGRLRLYLGYAREQARRLAGDGGPRDRDQRAVAELRAEHRQHALHRRQQQREDQGELAEFGDHAVRAGVETASLRDLVGGQNRAGAA